MSTLGISSGGAPKKRRSRLWLVVLYATSTIPAILLAMNFEKCRRYAIVVLGGQPDPVMQQQVLPVFTTPRPKQQVTPPNGNKQLATAQISPAPIRREKSVEVVAEPMPSLPPLRPEPIARAEPRPALQVKPQPDFVFALDLTRRRQRCNIAATPNGAPLRVLGIDGINARYKLQPADGTFDAENPLTISFTGPTKAWIAVSLDRAAASDGTTTIWLEYLVHSQDGRPIPFTTRNLAGIRRRTTKNGRQATAAVAGMVNEQQQLQAWIDAPVLKPLAERNQARARVDELSRLIPIARQQVAALEADVKATETFLQLAKSLHGAKLNIAVDDGSQPGERQAGL